MKTPIQKLGLLALVVFLSPCNCWSQIITTVAGGNMGDGEATTNASLFLPASVAFDTAGNLYIADYYNHRIRKAGTNGIITTVAGNGSATYSGDGGMATNASLNLPISVALDAAGNLYIADLANNRIRKVGPNGIITTVAGKSTNSFSGDGGAATNASLFSPSGVAIDAVGNLYIADTYNNRIRKVGTNGIITTVAGKSTNSYSGDGGIATSASLNSPNGVALDSAGNLYIADLSNNRIRKVGTNGIITTVAGNGTASYSGDFGVATNASLRYPSGIALDIAGNLYIADNKNHRIRKVGTNGNIATVAGDGYGAPNYGRLRGDGGAATSASLNYPRGVAMDATGNLYIADAYNHRIRKVGTNGIINTVIGGKYGGDGGSAISAGLNLPSAVALDAVGNLYIADPYDYRIRKVETNGIIITMAGGGTNFIGDGSTATNAILLHPRGVAMDTSGNLYIADDYNNRIRKVWTNGIITTVAGNGNPGFWGDSGAATNAGLSSPSSVAFDTVGNLYIADSSNNRIRKVETNGIITTVAGNGTAAYFGDGSAAINASLWGPFGVTLDVIGNLYIADLYSNRIRKVGTNGIITTIAGNGNGAPNFGAYSGDGGTATNAGLYWPTGVAIDAAGNLYIADEYNNRIRKVGTNGIITTVAGNGGYGFSGDGGVATNASLHMPSGVAIDAAGNLYIADSNNHRIRKVTFLSTPQNFAVLYSTTNRQLSFQLSGTPNYPYILLSTTNLTLPINWQPVTTNLADTNGSWQSTDTNLDSQQKFYRVVGQ